MGVPNTEATASEALYSKECVCGHIYGIHQKRRAASTENFFGPLEAFECKAEGCNCGGFAFKKEEKHEEVEA